MEKRIHVYHTHIEVYPYELGEHPKIEHQLSIWIDAEFRYDPIGFYIKDDTLYIPRGFNTYILEKEFGVKPINVYECDTPKTFRGVNILVPPKNELQEDAIDFLCGEGKYPKASRYSQQALILKTGEGKTYVTVHSIVKQKLRAVIITHQEKIKKQWIETFQTMTDIPEDKLVNISGSKDIDMILSNKKSGYIYFVNHQTLGSYMSGDDGIERIGKLFKKMGVGIKVYDEAHLEFRNILRIDFFTNTKHTYYLTATFDRSDQKESRLFKKAFNATYQYNSSTNEFSEDSRKHIIYVPVLYRSNPSYYEINKVRNMYGFSVLKFSKYALHEDIEQTQLRVFYRIFEIANRMEGKILITVSKIEDTEYIKECIKKTFPDNERSISIINSTHTKEENELAKESDIIVSTIKSSGTGVDIKGLRCIINLEPFSSNITTDQLSGRLREYAKDKDTYFFDLIDIDFPSCENQYKTKMKRLKKKCKEIKIMNA